MRFPAKVKHRTENLQLCSETDVLSGEVRNYKRNIVENVTPPPWRNEHSWRSDQFAKSKHFAKLAK